MKKVTSGTIQNNHLVTEDGFMHNTPSFDQIKDSNSRFDDPTQIINKKDSVPGNKQGEEVPTPAARPEELKQVETAESRSFVDFSHRAITNNTNNRAGHTSSIQQEKQGTIVSSASVLKSSNVHQQSFS